MEIFDSRLHSFDKPKSKPSNKSSAARVWPHPDTFLGTPTTLAEAGFFFKPSKDDPDNVQCFICKKELGGWDEDDNPFETHFKKCPKCPWAITRCSLEFDVDADGNFSITDASRLPTNRLLEKARADTFGGKKWWPHDAVKNHGATSKKMAKAGFVYTPQFEGDDTATCFYCNLSLSGWDADDDPTGEHKKRVERSGKACPFFQPTGRPKSQASTRSTKGTSRKSRAVKRTDPAAEEEESPTIKAPVKKGKRKQSEPDSLSKIPTRLSDGEDTEDLEEDDDPSLKVQVQPSVPRKSSRKPSSKSKPVTKVSGKNKQQRVVPSKEADESEQETSSKPARSRTKSGKGRRKEQGVEKEVNDKEESDKPPSNVNGKIAKSYIDFTVDINAAEEEKKKEKSRGRGERGRSASRGRSRSKTKSRSTDTSILADPNMKPLLRVSSRTRASGVTEAEEMETERMLAETPSDTDPESERERKLAKEPSSSTQHETPRAGDQAGVETEDTPRKSVHPTPKNVSVATEKPASTKIDKQVRAPARKTAAESRDKRSNSGSKPIELTGQSGESDGNKDIWTVEDVAQTVARDQCMDIDRSDEQGYLSGRTTSKRLPVVSKQQLVPTPTALSDFKIEPSRATTKQKSALKSTSGPDGPTQITDSNTSAHSGDIGIQKPNSAEAKKPRSRKGRRAPEPAEDEGRGMEVDEDQRSRLREDRDVTEGPTPQPQSPIEAPTTSSSQSTEPNANHLPRPTTPEHQIMRSDPPNGNADAMNFRTSLHVPTSPADLFLPPLANAPVPVMAVLSEEERAMTIEQWIRHEMTIQHQRLKEDGERRIRAFLEKAEETRRRIEAL